MSKVAQAQPDDEKQPRAAAAMASAGSFVDRTKAFLAEVKAEAKRVTWPNFKQIRATTMVVIITVFFFGIYFGILDWVFNYVVRRLLQLGS